MVLERQLLEFAFSAGVDESTDSWMVQGPKLLSLTNGRLLKAGAIQKRYGYTALSGGTLSASIDGLAVHDRRQLLAFGRKTTEDSTGVYTYTSQGTDGFLLADKVSDVTASRQPVLPVSISNASVTTMDSAAVGNVVVVVFSNSVQLRYQVFDAVTGVVLTQDTLIAAAESSPQLVTTGDGVVWLFTVLPGAPAVLKYRKMNVTGGAFTFGSSSTWGGGLGVASVAIGGSSGYPFGVATLEQSSGVSYIASAHQSASSGNRVVLVYSYAHGGSLTLVTSFSDAMGGHDIGAFGLYYHSDTVLYIGYSHSDGVASYGSCAVYDSAGAALVGNVQLYTVGASLVDYGSSVSVTGDGTRAFVLYGAESKIKSYSRMVEANATLSSFLRTHQGVYPASKLVKHSLDGTTWNAVRVLWSTASSVDLYYTNFTQPTYVYAEIANHNDYSSAYTTSTSRPLATIAPRLAAFDHLLTDALYPAPHVVTLSDGSVAIPIGVRTSAEKVTVPGANDFSIQLASLTKFSRAERQAAQLGSLTYISGGVPSYYDGTQVGEVSFIQYPEGSAAITSGGALTGVYSWKLTYEWVDSTGAKHVSAPVNVRTAATDNTITATADSITITAPALNITTRQDQENGFRPAINCVVWRTLAGGSVYYRLGPTSAITPDDGAVTFVDNASDATVAAYELLYTNGGQLGSVCPPSARLVCTHKNRVFFAGCDDPGVIYYSTEYLDQTEAPRFNDEFTIRCDEGGEITAIASLDDKLVIFKANAIYVVFGDFPNESGNFASLSLPQLVAADVGAVGAGAVARIPAGLTFQSEQGIMLLTRGLEVMRIGDAIRDSELTRFDSVTTPRRIISSLVHPTDGEVRFYQESDTAYAKALIHNYIMGQWSVDVHQDTPSVGNSEGGTAGAVVYDGAVHLAYVGESGNGDAVGVESRTLYSDYGNSVTLTAGTAWLRLSGIQHYQRIWMVQALSEAMNANAQLSMTVYTDYETANSISYSAMDLGTSGTTDARFPKVAQYRARLPAGRQRAQSIRIVFSVANGDSGGLGLVLKGIALEIGATGRIRQTAAARKR